MKIGIAGPVTLHLLARHIDGDPALPVGYDFPPMALWIGELLARGHEVSVFTTSRGIPEPQTFRGWRLTLHVGRMRDDGKAKDFFRQERADLVALMQQDPCDVLHAHWTYEFALAALASGMPTLVTAHDAPWQVLRLVPNPYRFMRVLMALDVARRAPRMTAVSPYIAEHFRRLLFYRRPIEVVPNAVSSEIFALGANRPRQLSNGCLTFATVLTGWGKLKNGAAAIRAFDIVRKRLGNAHMVMFGPGFGHDEPAAKWAHEQRLSSGIEFAGNTEHAILLRRMVQEVDVLVHPSLEESFGVAVAEAMAIGMPVVAGAHSGGIPYVLEYGRAGMLVDVSSPAAIAAAMVQLGSSAERRAERSQAARESACRRFTPASVLKEYEKLYSQVACTY